MRGHLDSLLDMTRSVLGATLAAGRESGAAAVAVDATAGNGHDTLFLAAAAGPGGTVYAFDVQAQALDATQKRLAAEGVLERVVLVHAGHQTVAGAVPAILHGQVRAATFNLGYLPGGDKGVVTVPATTLTALEALLPMMARGGIISVHCYRGHDGGEAEGRAVSGFLAHLPWDAWRVARYDFANKVMNAETLFLAERIA